MVYVNWCSVAICHKEIEQDRRALSNNLNSDIPIPILSLEKQTNWSRHVLEFKGK
jgi:hypothetical protein